MMLRGGSDTHISRSDHLEKCLLRFHGVTGKQVLDEVGYLRDAGDTVIAGGSLAYGLGNHFSDLDLLVVGSDASESSWVPLEQFIGSLRVDVWKLSREIVDDAFARAKEALAGAGALGGSFGDCDHETDLKLLHRIAYGVVVDGPPLVPSPGRSFREVAGALVAREYVERMRSSALLARLALEAGWDSAAVLNARQAVEEGLNAVVARRGLAFSGDKWLRQRLLSEAADLVAVHDPFRRLPDDPARDARLFSDRALAACTTLWGLDLRPQALLPLARWRNTDLRLLEVEGEQLLVSPACGVVWCLAEAEARAWRSIPTEGPTSQAVAWALSECGEEASALCLRLYGHGLLQLEWESGVAVDRPAVGGGGGR
jgi:HEPN domain-containing protein